jgi:putative ATPase
VFRRGAAGNRPAPAPIYDKGRRATTTSSQALHKTIRGSDPDAALYYLADARRRRGPAVHRAPPGARGGGGYLASPTRRRFAGRNAARTPSTSWALPKGELRLAQAAIYLATAPKSNAVYTAYKAATRTAKEAGSLTPAPRDPQRPDGADAAHGVRRRLRYDHDEPDAFSGQDYWPDALGRRRFYKPTERGHEGEIGRRLERWAALRKKRQDIDER